MVKNDEQILNMKEKDILSKLMGTYEVPTVTVVLDRIGIPLTLKGLSSKEISTIRKECTYSRKVKGNTEEKLDGSEFDAGLIVAATTNFNWKAPELLEHHKASDGKQLIRKMLLAGEISSITGKIMEVSGYNDELEEIEDVKN
jgi:Phage XkdN-like protein.